MPVNPILGIDSQHVPVRVDVERLVASRMLIQANSGAGKSWCLRRILEQTHGRVQHLVIDVEDEFHTLREKHDYILAGRAGGDCPADTRCASLLARRLLELNVSAIVGIYELKAWERQRFVKQFLDALVNAPRELWHPALIVVDEAHLFCPQNGSAESAGAVIDLMTRGRKRGFCGILATQRISKLHKDAAAECNNKLIGRSALDVDMKRAADELGFTTREQQHGLRILKPGQFFAFGPALCEVVTCMQVAAVETTHPRAGQHVVAPSAPGPKVRSILAKLADLPAEAEQEAQTVEQLKARVRELERHSKAAPAPSRETLKAEYDRGYLQGEEAAWLQVNKLRNKITDAIGVLMSAGELMSGKIVPITQAHAPVPAQATPVSAPPCPSVLPPAKLRILNALAWLRSIGIGAAEKAQLAFLADASPTSGAYLNNLGALRSAGFIEYPNTGLVALTDDGMSVADPQRAPQNREELHQMILRKLPPAKQRIVQALIRLHPATFSKEGLADAVQASATSGAFLNNLGSLRTLGLIIYPGKGMVAAAPVLFSVPE